VTTLTDLADTLTEVQGALYATPMGVDSEWVRRLARLICEARELLQQLAGEDEVPECQCHGEQR